jgi:hypothetical protein
MRLQVVLVAVLVGGGVTASGDEQVPKAAASDAAQEGTVDPRADAALQRMSHYVGGLRSFRVAIDTVDDKVATDGQKIEELQQSTVTVRRPGELRVDRVSPNGRALFIDNGKQFSLYNKDKNVYATHAAPATLDQALEVARDRLHLDAPAGDLILTDAYSALVDGTMTGRYIGLEPIDGVMAHHLAFTKQNTDWQIWIKYGAEAVPLRFVITSKDMPGQPKFTAELRDWMPNAPTVASQFMFTPPAGAQRIDLTKRQAQR